MSLLLSIVLAIALPAPLVQQPPRDPRPADVSRAQAAENAKARADLEQQIAASPDDIQLRTKLAKLQLAGGDFEKAVATLEQIEQIEPTRREHPQVTATFYWDKAFRDHTLTDAQKRTYVQAGIAATDRALTLDPDYVEAMTYKNILLRMQAQMEADPATAQQLIAQADELRTRAMSLQRQRSLAGMPERNMVSVAPVPPPPPPPPGAYAEGPAPVRVGGNVKPPTKIKDVRPIYPQEAMGAKVQGVVIIEATIDTQGFVSDAKVLRSIPLLDQAALDAVRQWEFTPTLFNGQPVPVIMTVTVNFTVQ
jgi:protein TonB